MVDNSDEVTREEEIENPKELRRHLVILGAGGSLAALPNGDVGGKQLPVMANFLEVVPKLKATLESHTIKWKGKDFESLYSELASNPKYESIRIEIEKIVFEYFDGMKLPKEATLYDRLMLSLRNKDVIATFNWDPFLIQAYRRSASLTKSLPELLFLHGNVAHGFCPEHKVSGLRGARCSKCHKVFEPDKLLFPVTRKDYSLAPSVAYQWERFREALKKALVVTIFGYGAPASDKEAVDIMSKAWGNWEDRQFEEIEIIDIRPEEDLREAWDRFIHTHHYEIYRSFSRSFLANHPRRSVEAFMNQFIEAKYIDDNPIPSTTSLRNLHEWFRPLVDAESRL